MGILLVVVVFGLVVIGVASLWNLRRHGFGGDPTTLRADSRERSGSRVGTLLGAVEVESKLRAAHRGTNYGDIGPR